MAYPGINRLECLFDLSFEFVCENDNYQKPTIHIASRKLIACVYLSANSKITLLRR